MCMMCLKYRITLLIVIKNPWENPWVLAYFLLRGAAPYPAGAGAITAPLRPPSFDIPAALRLQFRHLVINLA